MEQLAADVADSIEPEIARAWLYALALAPARITPMMIILPVFAKVGISGFLRTAMVMALSLVMVPPIAATLAQTPPEGVLLAGLILKEVFIGLVIAMIVGVVFWGFEAAGNILDFQRGASIAVDSTNPDQPLVTGTFFGVVFGTFFILAGGLMTVLGIYYDSYVVWPVLELLPAFGDTTVAFFLSLLDRIMLLGLVVAGPIIIIMFAAEITLALLTRIAPQMNVFILALGVKSALMFLFLPLYMAYLLDRFGQEVGGVGSLGELLEGVLL